MITQSINLSMVPGGVPPVIHVSQYDTGTRTLVFTITDPNPVYTGMSVRIEGHKADGNVYSYANGDETEYGTFSISRSGNVVTSDCLMNMTAAKGEARCALVFYNEDETRLECADFIMDIKEAVIADDAVISETELPAVIALAKAEMEAAEASEAAAAASEVAAAQSEENSEAWAVGQRGGVDVDSGDETYHNNSKYYAENAGTSESNSEAWAVGQRGGTDVGSSDPTYHNNSKYYSELSADSESNSEAWATGKRGGQAVPSTDETYHNNSEYYANLSDASRQDSEAWAVGERNGTAVGSSDETYENNSKFYARDSEAWANGTRNGQPIINTDPAYEKNSKYWSDLAGIYADYVVPHFIIQNNRLYLRDDSTPVFTVANNRLYIQKAVA